MNPKSMKILNEAEWSMNLLHSSNVLKSRVSTESVWVRHRFVHQLSPYTEDLRPLPGMTLHTFWTHGTQTDTTKNCTDAQASAMLKNLALLLHWNTSNMEHVKLYTSTVYWEDMKCLVNHILSQNKQYISISKVYQYPHEDLKHPETVSTIMSSKPQLPERCVTVPKGRPHRLSVICF